MSVVYGKESKFTSLIRNELCHMVIFHWMIGFPFREVESKFDGSLVASPLSCAIMKLEANKERGLTIFTFETELQHKLPMEEFSFPQHLNQRLDIYHFVPTKKTLNFGTCNCLEVSSSSPSKGFFSGEVEKNNWRRRKKRKRPQVGVKGASNMGKVEIRLRAWSDRPEFMSNRPEFMSLGTSKSWAMGGSNENNYWI
ncbi:hypothetical protein LXL04_038640 [Taraxacum kok-saghyz]